MADKSLKQSGPFVSVSALITDLKRVRLPTHAAGYDDADYSAAQIKVAEQADSEYRQTVREELLQEFDEVHRESLRESAPSEDEDADEARSPEEKAHVVSLREARELIASLPDEMADYVATLCVAIDLGAQRRGIPNDTWHDESLTKSQLATMSVARKAHRNELLTHLDRLNNLSARGGLHVPGFNWLFGSGIYVARAVVYAFFWVFEKIKLNYALLWLPLWMMAAIFDLLTFSLPWLAFAGLARVLRGQTTDDRRFDRWMGCWAFGASIRARLDYGKLRRFKHHRRLVDEHTLLLHVTSHASWVAAAAEALKLTPKRIEPPKVPGEIMLKWWAPRAGIGVYAAGCVAALVVSALSQPGVSVNLRAAAAQLPVSPPPEARPSAAPAKRESQPTPQQAVASVNAKLTCLQRQRTAAVSTREAARNNPWIPMEPSSYFLAEDSAISIQAKCIVRVSVPTAMEVNAWLEADIPDGDPPKHTGPKRSQLLQPGETKIELPVATEMFPSFGVVTFTGHVASSTGAPLGSSVSEPHTVEQIDSQ